MNPMIQAVASGVTGAQTPLGLNHYSDTHATTLHVELVSGSATFTVQYTVVPLGQPHPTTGVVWTAANAPWIASSISAATATATGQLPGPATYVRLNVASSTDGVINFYVLQGGGPR